MEYTIQTSSAVKVVMMSGRITSRDFDTFKNFLTLFEEPGSQNVVLDFAGVDFIDSMALGMIMLVRDKAHSKGGGLALRGAKGQVKRLMEMVKFDKAMN